MGHDRWERVKEILDGGLDCPKEERSAYLERACAGDAALRSEVEALLQSDDDTTSFLDPPTRGAALSILSEVLQQESPTEPTNVGKYALRDVIASGGMGTVYKAIRTDGYDQAVAVKLIKPGMATDEILKRFRRERQTLAKLEHPNIARLLDGGASDTGAPYLVMELIDGKPITRYCDRQRLSVDERIDVFKTACRAVQYAHRNLVVHRDLKPSNILVSDDGQLKLVDFGISKILTGEERAQMSSTESTQRLMTPQYASPEQMRGDVITTASDVYSLGVVLYELLTGSRPYEVSGKRHAEAERLICETQPSPPSTVVLRPVPKESSATTLTRTPAELSEFRRMRPEKLCHRLRGDLDTIVLTAMHKDPERRYPSVEQFSEDLGRFLSGLPVRARRDSFGYRAGKFVLRHKVGVAAAVIVAISLGAGVLGTTLDLVEKTAALKMAQEEAERARLETLKSQRVTAFLQDMLGAADPYSELNDPHGTATDITVKHVLDDTALGIDKELSEEPVVRAAVHHTLGVTYQGLGEYAEAEKHLDEALEIREIHLGPEHEQTAASLTALGGLLYERGHREAALERVSRAEAIIEKLELQDTPHAVPVYNQRGKLYQSANQLEDAELLFRRALLICRRELGPTHRNTLASLNNVAAVCAKQEKFEESERTYRELMDRAKDSLGPSHPWTLAYTNNSCVLLMRLNRSAEVETVYRDIYAASVEQLGEDHPRTMTALSNLAFTLAEQMKIKEAVEHYKSVLAVRQRILTEDHPDTLGTMGSLGLLYRSQREFDLASSYFREMLSRARTSLGATHPVTLDALSGMGLIHADQGMLSEALPYSREAFETGRSVFGMSNSKTFDYGENHAGFCLRLKRYDEAESLHAELIEVMAAELGDTDPRVSKLKGQLAMIYLDTGRFQNAHALLERLLALQEGGPRTPGDLIILNNLARAKAGLSDLEGAEAMFDELLEQSGSMLPAGFWLTAMFEGYRGECLLRQGRYEEAERALLGSHATLSAKFGERHDKPQRVASILTLLYRKTAEPEKAARFETIDPTMSP